MSNQHQPEALQLAELLEQGQHLVLVERKNAADELRRLHAIEVEHVKLCLDYQDTWSSWDRLLSENAALQAKLMHATKSALDHKERRDELLAVLRMARESIGNSLQSLIETETHPMTGMVEHEGALLVIESEQDLLNQIDAAIGKAGGAALEQHQHESNSDNGLQSKTPTSSTSSSSVPQGWKLVPVNITDAMYDAWADDDGDEWTAWKALLAAAPQPPTTEQSSAVRQPLTNEQIDVVWDTVPQTQYWWRRYARAIERAHGIGGEA